jgi:hypothetical protein
MSRIGYLRQHGRGRLLEWRADGRPRAGRIMASSRRWRTWVWRKRRGGTRSVSLNTTRFDHGPSLIVLGSSLIAMRGRTCWAIRCRCAIGRRLGWRMSIDACRGYDRWHSKYTSGWCDSMLKSWTTSICRFIPAFTGSERAMWTDPGLLFRLTSFVPFLIFWNVWFNKLNALQSDHGQGSDGGRR